MMLNLKLSDKHKTSIRYFMNFNYIPYFISFCENNINNNVEQLVATIIILMRLTAKPIVSILIITYSYLLNYHNILTISCSSLL